MLIVDILSFAGWKGWQEEKTGEERQAEGCDGLKGATFQRNGAGAPKVRVRSLSTEGAEQEFEHRKVRERRLSTVSAGAGGIVGGVVAVIVRVLGGG